MPKKPIADDSYVPMDIMQPQRIKVLEATVAQQAKQIAQLTKALAKANAARSAVQAVGANRKMWKKTLGRRPKYTKEVLLDVWQAHQRGEHVAAIAARLEADATMLKIFLKGDYWTEAAKAVYAELGIPDDLPGDSK